ncbi:xylose isomerase domain-containing protein [Acetobacter nitrogenifigens DSM 23921 = NBRC 105050]|uniref:Xylose isomerase n=1 Tax=Acetobacter nitrogenifigens DSM 23921 = NBRC 105050 TaxID=1120919 RepID=A0A511XCU2_9PROT|nr:sugar phosphate isomerase/epimerase [Acetobacter nitrogenifigens]GBQ87909.1 xylose isomerase domain-containing protein [Acetobacter nitrogenifigens DSM 23921 = NBRC 105050]GEN60695.1 xylose isomerase [Acetobacter nitrogenifigens DSM 23921 = NBRC 105050]
MKIGTDLVTFYNPVFWGVDTAEAITSLAVAQPRAFWTRILDSLQQAGLSGVELTFPPFDWRGAIFAFGSADAFKHELDARSIEVWSCFFPDLDRIPIANYGASEAEILESVTQTAQFLSSIGGTVLVAGLPCRTTFLEDPLSFVDLALAQPIATLLNRMGAAAAREGVRLALHTEAHSLFCAPRDVDLFLLLTDPRYVHLCLDPAHIILEGGLPESVLERHLERTVAAHWKDAIGPMPVDTPITADIHSRHRPFFCELGEGRAPFAKLNALLTQAPLLCGPILELDACPDPIPALQRGVSFVRTLATADSP